MPIGVTTGTTTGRSTVQEFGNKNRLNSNNGSYNDTGSSTAGGRSSTRHRGTRRESGSRRHHRPSARTSLPSNSVSVITTLFLEWVERFLVFYLGINLALAPHLHLQYQEDRERFTMTEKARRIEQCLGLCSSPPSVANDDGAKTRTTTASAAAPVAVNLWELRELALTRGGLLESKYRQDAWLRLVGTHNEEMENIKQKVSNVQTNTNSNNGNDIENNTSPDGSERDSTQPPTSSTTTQSTSTAIKSRDLQLDQEDSTSPTTLPPTPSPPAATATTTPTETTTTNDPNFPPPTSTTPVFAEGKNQDTEVVVNEEEEEEKEAEEEEQQGTKWPCPAADSDLIRRDVGRSVIFRYRRHEEPQALSRSIPSPFGTGSTSADQRKSAYLDPADETRLLVQVLEDTIGSSYATGGGTDSPPGGTSPMMSPSTSSPLSSTSQSTPAPLHYYQGLHDVAGVLLHHLDYETEATTCILRRLSQAHLRDAMRENFGTIAWLLRVLLLPLVEKVDAHIHYALVVGDIDLATICLPWIITWFTHDVHDPITAGRLVDAFLASHPLMPVYFAVALLTHPILKRELLATVDDDGPEDPSSTLFGLIKQLPQAIGPDEGTVSSGLLVGKVDEEAPSAAAGAASDEPWVGSARSLWGEGDGSVIMGTKDKIPVQEFLDDAISIIKRFPPRALWDLIDPDIQSPQEVLHRASNVSMFKAPSWSMRAGDVVTPAEEDMLGSMMYDGEGGDDDVDDEDYVQVTDRGITGGSATATAATTSRSPPVRAKLASGVPLLMVTVSQAEILSSPAWGSRRHLKKRKRLSTWQKLERMVWKTMGMGYSTTASTTTGEKQ